MNELRDLLDDNEEVLSQAVELAEGPDFPWLADHLELIEIVGELQALPMYETLFQDARFRRQGCPETRRIPRPQRKPPLRDLPCWGGFLFSIGLTLGPSRPQTTARYNADHQGATAGRDGGSGVLGQPGGGQRPFRLDRLAGRERVSVVRSPCAEHGSVSRYRRYALLRHCGVGVRRCHLPPGH